MDTGNDKHINPNKGVRKSSSIESGFNLSKAVLFVREKINAIFSKIYKKGNIFSSSTVLDYPNYESIPYSFHYNKETVITQNGEIVQVICFDYSDLVENFFDIDVPDIRSLIRVAISKIVDESDVVNCSFYIHNIRERVDLAERNEFPKDFLSQIKVDWDRNNNMPDEFKNIIYLTVVVSGIGNRFNLINYISYLSFYVIKARYRDHFKKAAKRADHITSVILKDLSLFSPKKLSIKKKGNIYESEIVSFLTKISFFDTKPRALLDRDLYSYFINSKIAFGYDAFEIYNKEEKKSVFGAILGIKAAVPVESEFLEEIFSVDSNILFTEALLFSKNTKSKERKIIERQNYILEVSKDKELQNLLGIKNYLEKEYSVNQYSSCMVIESSIKELNKKVNSIVSKISQLGYVVFRHNLRMEQVYWSQLPCNFSSLTFKRHVHFGESCVFAHIKINSMSDEYYWGNIISLFNSKMGGVFRFNFRYKGSSSVLIAGTNDDVNLFSNFLLANAQIVKPTVFILDSEVPTAFFIQAIEGAVVNVGFDGFGFDPICFDFDNQEQSVFLKLLMQIFGSICTEQEMKNAINLAINSNFSCSGLEFISESLKKQGSSALLNKFFGVFSGLNKRSIEDGVSKQFYFHKNIDMEALEFAIAFIFERIISLVRKKNKKVIILIRDNGIFSKTNILSSSGINYYLKIFDQLGIAFILSSTCLNKNRKEDLGYLSSIVDNFATKIFFPHLNAKDVFEQFGLFDSYVADVLSIAALHKYNEIVCLREKKSTVIQFDLNNVMYKQILWPNKNIFDSLSANFQKNHNIDNWIKDFF